MSLDERVARKQARSRCLKAHEIFLFWLAALAFWDFFFSSALFALPNIHYLTFPSATWTLIELVKRRDDLKQLSLHDFLGKTLSPSEAFKLIFFTPVVVAIGVGGWSLLVLIGAKIDPERAYQVWHLMMPSDFDKIEWSYSWLAVELICAGIVAPIAEEIVFRGIILQALLKKYSLGVAIIMTSLLFSIFHFDKSVLSAFIHSVIFSVVAVRFSSLYAPMLIHGLYNLMATILRVSCGVSLIADRNHFSSALYWLPELSLLVVALLVCVAYTIYTFHEQKRSTTCA
jgi:membrane protease YdiL (CAAX protease family)